MVVIYGIPDSEYELLRMYPKSVKKFGDIDKAHQELINELKQEQKGFFGKISRWNKKKRTLKIFRDRTRFPKMRHIDPFLYLLIPIITNEW